MISLLQQGYRCDLAAEDAAYLADVLLRVFPPQLLIFFTEAHEGQHASGEEVICMRLHLLPGGRQGQGVREVLQAKVDHPWGQPLSLQPHSCL